MAEWRPLPLGQHMIEMRREMKEIPASRPGAPDDDGYRRFMPGPTRYYIDGVEVTREEATALIQQLKGGTDGDLWR